MRPRHGTLLAVLAAAVAALLGVAAVMWNGARDEPAPAVSVADTAPQEPLRYDVEYPAIAYTTTAPADRIAALRERIATGESELEFDDERGYLDSLLQELDIDPASQLLVFSTTSLQTGSIRPRTPRAIYFNDDTYVAWVQGAGPIEVASMDPGLGPVFYTLQQTARAGFERHTVRCLKCHDSLSLTGGGVPRFILGSGYIGTRGNIVAHEGWILTTQRTPLRNRFGGWYVTGHHGTQKHLGNIIVKDIADLQNVDRLRIGNLDSLESLVDMSPYAAPGSDIAALMVIQHQVDVQNEISRVNFEVRSALYDEARGNTPSAADASTAAGTTAEDVGAPAPRFSIADSVEPLVEAMLFVGEVPLTDTIAGSPDFVAAFEGRGPRDSQGRSLRELDLTTRLMRHPFSYLVYSRAFDALPEAAKAQLFRRFAQVLRGEDRADKFAHLSDEDRRASLEILAETKPEFASVLTVTATDLAIR